MTFAIAEDISNHNGVLTKAYAGDLIITKATQGTYFTDQHWATNTAVCEWLHAHGHLAGQIGYHVYTAESVSAQFAKFRSVVGVRNTSGALVPAPHVIGAMVDEESWPGTSYALKGDHSYEINQLWLLMADWFDSARAAWQYANESDFANLNPHRDPRAPLILAAYTSDLRYKRILGDSAIGQQYSDGETKWAVPTLDGHALPRYTPGLGYVDHNVFPGFANGFALARWIITGGTDMSQFGPASWDAADWKALAGAITANTGGVKDALHTGAFGDWNKFADGHHKTLEQVTNHIPGFEPFPVAHKADAPAADVAAENIADRPVPGDHVPHDARTMHAGTTDAEEAGQ